LLYYFSWITIWGVGGSNSLIAQFEGSSVILERMVQAVEKVRSRLLRTAAALESAGVPYAVVGGNAVAAWVATIDEAAVRNTQDVDILLDRRDLARAIEAMAAARFIHREVNGVDLFLDGPQAGPRDAVHVVFAGELVRSGDPLPTPGLEQSVRFDAALQTVTLDALVRMKLTSYRRKDQVHLLDMIAVGLVDQRTLASLPAVLAQRLRQLLEQPEG
jgi:hypothetical protein